jgi:hypothetical protein
VEGGGGYMSQGFVEIQAFSDMPRDFKKYEINGICFTTFNFWVVNGYTICK